MDLNSKNIFLIDSLGALASSAMLGIVLPFFQPLVGMPLSALHLLAFLAIIFFIYSLSCHFFLEKKRIWLQIIIGANLGYCILSLIFMVIYKDELTNIGYVYFVVEKLVVFWVVFLERRVLRLLK